MIQHSDLHHVQPWAMHADLLVAHRWYSLNLNNHESILVSTGRGLHRRANISKRQQSMLCHLAEATCRAPVPQAGHNKEPAAGDADGQPPGVGRGDAGRPPAGAGRL
jgi:hypothetical protein